MWYKIYAGVFSEEYIKTEKYSDENEAVQDAYNEAINIYESYEGYHGIASREDIENEPEEYGLSSNYDEDELEACYMEHRENWLLYSVKLATGPDDIDE